MANTENEYIIPAQNKGKKFIFSESFIVSHTHSE